MDQNLRIRPAALLPLRDHRAFLDYYFNQGGIGGVFVPGYVRLASAEEVDLEVAFATEQVTIHSRGVIRWKRLTDKKSLPAGVGVEFLANERRTRDLLLEFARGKLVTLTRRRSRRYPVMLEIEYTSNSVFLADVTDDLSRDGASVLTEADVEPGEVIDMRLKPAGGLEPIEVKAEVRWCQDTARRGFGVRFVFDRPGSESRVRDLIERVKHQQATDFGVPAAP